LLLPDHVRQQVRVAMDSSAGLIVLAAFAATAGVGVVAYLFARRMEETNRAYQTRMEAAFKPYLAFMERVANGDLTAQLDLSEVDKHGEALGQLGRNLNAMVEGLHAVAQQLKNEADAVSAAASEILNATNEQIVAATEQDSSVTQTSATVNEVRATVTETAERAQAVAETAQKSVDVSRAGEQSVTDTINGMHMIRQRVEGIADTILILSEHTQQIGEIIATVNAIADQSKLLALNASVEAARAGEEGKGFAVVAMEVRNLAEQSREAVSQVRDILNEIQQTTNTAVMVTEQGTKGVDNGMTLVERAGEAIRELAGTIEEASNAAIQIAASTRQQTVGVDQLSEAMQNIRDMTATNLSSTMRVERAARELNQVARRMEVAVSQFKL
jgi:methyl-accepting chemotaxis protein